MSWCLSSARTLASLPVAWLRLGTPYGALAAASGPAGRADDGLRQLARRGLHVRQQPPPEPAQLPEVEPVEVDWRHVERLLARPTVPVPAEKERYPSGWTPQRGNDSLPYTVRRSVNHMLPVYLRIKESGVKRLTIVRNVRGDIWAFHKELKQHLEKLNAKYIASQVNEVTQYVQFKGEYVAQVKQWLRERGL